MIDDLSKRLCPLCQEGFLIAKLELFEITYMNITDKVTLYYDECNICRSEITDNENSRKNKHNVLELRKKIESYIQTRDQPNT